MSQKTCVSWMGDLWCSVFDMYKRCHSSLILKSILKPMDLLYFVLQFYLNLRLAAVVSHFYKFNANLVMFTTINIYETIFNSTFIIFQNLINHSTLY